MELKLLIKRAYKSLFRNKFFTVLMMLLVFLSSATYTIFESTTSNYNRSYNTLFNNAMVHQAIVRENFKISPRDKVEVNQIKTASGSYTPLTSAALQANALQVSANLFEITIATSQDYDAYGYRIRPNLQVQFSLRNMSWDAAVADIVAAGGALQAEVEDRLRGRLADSFISGLNQLYPSELIAAPFSSTNIHTQTSAYKVVQTNTDAVYSQVNRMFIYEGTGTYSLEKSDETLTTELRQAAAVKWPSLDYDRLTINDFKKFRISAVDPADVTRKTATIFDPSAFQAIVSPSYAQYYSKIPISPAEFASLVTSDWRQYYPESITPETTFLDAMSSKLFVDRFAPSVIYVDAMPFFIIGIGATPDLAYPVIDESTPAIDVSSQAVVYVNNRGYQRVRDAFRANQQENFISLAFHNATSSERRAAILQEIEQISQSSGGATVRGISFPENTFSTKAQMVLDLNSDLQSVSLAQVRAGFLNSLNNTIGTISIITTSLLAIFVSTIVIMVFNVLLRTDRKSLATLLALGYKRSIIAVSTAFISFILGAMPAIIGYLVGFGSRYLLAATFADFWTLPTFGASVSYVSILITVLLPTFLMFLLIFVAALFTIRHDIKTMIFDISLRNTSLIETLIRPFRFVSIRSKYIIALTLRNAGKLLLVSLATVTSTIALLVGFSTIGKGNEAYKETIAVTNYEYKFDLYSPTTEGGQYRRVNYQTGLVDPVNKIGQGYFNTDNSLVSYAETYAAGTTNDARLQPHWHIVGTGDNAYTDTATISNYLAAPQANLDSLVAVKNYLQYKLQFKSLIDKRLLDFVNPWDIVKQLMPDNQQNLSSQSVTDLRNTYSQVILNSNLNPSIATDLFEQILINERLKVDAQGNVTSTTYHPYLLSYNAVVTNGDDEEYSYLDTDLVLGNQVTNYHITGIKENSEMYNLASATIGKLKAFNKPGVVPVVVNKFMQARYGLSPGTVLSSTVKNHAQRNFNNFTAPLVSLEVVDIINGYNNSGFITLQSIVNPVLGYDASGFNGIMSSHSDAALASSIPLYSPSGFYLPTDSFGSGSIYEQFLNASLSNAALWSYSAAIAQNSSEFYSKYSRSIFAPMFTQVAWKAMDEQTFSSVSNLSAILINVIEAVSIILSIIFTFIVTSLIIRSNRKRIATLWALGYRKKEVIAIFTAQFGVAILLSLAIAIPIAIVILQEVLRNFVINLGQILIPFELVVWSPFAVIAILATIFVTSTTYSIGTLSSQHALQAFKAD